MKSFSILNGDALNPEVSYSLEHGCYFLRLMMLEKNSEESFAVSLKLSGSAEDFISSLRGLADQVEGRIK